MSRDGSSSGPVYSAFLSYSRRDIAVAERIHKRLETYRLPRRLHPHSVAWDRHGRRLKPVFRDIDEMAAARDLGTAIDAAIASSAFLIVLCSPELAQSDWVGREITMFRAAHGDANILAALVGGSAATAYHPALLRGDDGVLRHPLAADFRPEGDGAHLARLKLVAVMAGVGLGELVRRDAQRRLRQIGTAAATVVVVVAIVGLLAVMALRSRADADRQSARAGTMSGYMLDDLRGKLKHYGSLGMLAEVNEGVMATFRGRDLAGLTDTELAQLAKLRLAIGEDAEQRGDLSAARTEIAEAARITATRLAAAPGDPQRIFDHAQSQYYVALIDWRAGDRRGAAAGYQAYRDLAGQLVARDPRNADWLMELGYSESNLGVFALRTRLDFATAERRFRAADAAFTKADGRRPRNATTISSLADTAAWLADTRRLAGDLAGARVERARQRALLERMAAADPLDRVVAADLATNDLAMARIALAEGRPAAALAPLAAGRAVVARLVADDPQNVARAAQLRMFDLVKLRAWLDLPRAQRPAAAVLAATNGDCVADRTRLKSAELATYCAILTAHRTGSAMPLNLTTFDGNRVSSNWGFDFAAEARRIPRL